MNAITALLAPPRFYRFAGALLPWLTVACSALFALGLYSGLVLAPPDYQQGDSYRIMFVHVPAAWLSMFAYVIVAIAGFMAWVWHIKLAEAIATAAAPVGASFTLLALVTGALWGKPMWGAWWVWDARLTSELILLFLYLGYIGLQSAIADPRQAARAGAVLALVGVVNLPIIHYSVIWWSTLHQGPTVSKLGAPSIHVSMLTPLLLMSAAFLLLFVIALLLRTRVALIARERRSAWVQALVAESNNERQ